MFFLFTYNSGSPLQARKTAPLFTVILILLIIVAIVVLIGIILRKIAAYKQSDKYLEKEKERITKYSDISKYANANELSETEKNILWDVCQATQWKNILYSLKDNSSVNELFKTAYRILKEKKYFTEKKLNLYFKTVFKIESIVAQHKKLISSKQIPVQSVIHFVNEEGEKFPFTIIENAKDFFVIIIPEFFIKSSEKPQILKQYRFVYKIEEGLSYNFVTRIIRYEENNPNEIRAIIAHTDTFECQTLRKFKREFFEKSCYFSAVAFLNNNKDEYKVKEKKFPGKITNISGGGCCIKTTLPIKENQYLCIFLNSIGINEGILGKIKRTRKLSGGLFSLHIQFIKLKLEIENKILTLVYKYDL